MQEEKLVEKQTKSENTVKLSRALRLLIFVGFVCLSIVMSGDNGVVSSSSKMIKKDLNLTDAQYGIFGSLPSTGRIFGSVLFMGLLATDNRKLLTVCALGINASAFFVYLLTSNKYILLGVRFTIGTVRVFPHIYIPVWVDQFGIKSLKTLMMTVINVTSPLGQVFGYSIGTFQPPERWRYSFCLVGILIWSLGLIIILSPSTYFSAKYMFVGYDDGERLVKVANQRTGNSVFENTGVIASKKKAKGGSMLAILKSGAYIFSAYTRANLLFIFQVIHLFITDYANNGLKVDDTKILLKYYGSASVFGPTLGGSFGGLVSTRLGGYEDKKSVWACIGFGLLTLAAVFPLAFAKNIYIFSISLFCFFFCASAILPTIVGYIISSVPKEHKGAGSSLNMLITTLCGNLPGPIVYGFINDKMKATDPTFAWKCVMFYFCAGFTSIVLACLFRYNDLSKDKSNEKKEVRVSNVSEHIAETAGEPYTLDEKNKPTPAANDVEEGTPMTEKPAN